MAPSITRAEVERRFSWHPVDATGREAVEQVREAAKMLAHTIAGQTPACREQSLAITALEEAVFWANAAASRPPIDQ